MKKSKIKYQFSVKNKDELANLTHEELLEYTRNLTDYCYKIEKPKKDSTNSSLPSSKDIAPPKNRRNQSTRESSGRLSGGQKGHRGTTLMQSDNPDETIEIEFTIDSCQKCGFNLSEVIAKLEERRQILDLDIQDTNKKITEYQSYSKECPACGEINHSNTYPDFVAPHISYGKNIMAIVVYLSVVHYISYTRIVDTLKTMYKLAISEGTIDNLLKKASKLSQSEMDKLIAQLELSDMVGIDETGVKVNTQRDWHWVFQNDSCTYIVHNESRGTKVIDEHFKNGFVDATVGHDNYSSYNSLIAKDEQLCLAHKLRDLNYAIDCDDTQVMKDMKLLLKEAMSDHKLDISQEQREILKEQYLLMFDMLLKTEAKVKSETAKE